ncbi:MAG TPA: CHAT domain-containing protein, partial [Thermoanaerobaculia bacterium]
AYALMTGSRRGPAFDSLFAVGNPLVGEADRKSFAALYRDAKLGPLPDAEREVREVGQLYARAVVLSGAEATESRTKSAAKKASVIHFATHALFDDAHPMSSRLALARDEAGADDGWLEAREIMNLDVDADLVVLSACETARGAIGGGEGVVGMAWSFFVAGARSTISTQWKVGTDSTAILMIDFHRTLHRSAATVPLRKARSLRDAQLRVLRDPRYRHPFHWAAFVILGDAS